MKNALAGEVDRLKKSLEAMENKFIRHAQSGTNMEETLHKGLKKLRELDFLCKELADERALNEIHLNAKVSHAVERAMKDALSQFDKYFKALEKQIRDMGEPL